MRKNTLKELTFAAMLGGAYAALTMLLPIPRYAGVQFRLAEALTLLPFLIPAATPGLFVGCFIANILSPYGLLDIIAGSAATLLACLWTQRMKHRRLAALPPVVCNAIIIGAVVTVQQVPMELFWGTFAYNALTIGIGEAISCCILGGLLLHWLEKSRLLQNL